jgi:ABC-type dipeptide/oligopeptide/nickel transport system permease subunit
MTAASTPTTAIRLMRFSGVRRVPVVFMVGVVVMVALTLMAVLAPWIAPYSPDAIDYNAINAGPSAAHWLGTDNIGRDLLSRAMYGGRTALLGPLLVVIGSSIIGIVLGVVAGWRGGWLDAVLGRVFDVLFAFPSLLIAMIAVALFGKGLFAPVLAMCISYAPYVARITRSLILSEKSRPYVAAYRVQGFGGAWIAARRVLPNVMPVIGVQSALNFGYVLMDLAALSFLGLGVQPPTPDWGAMINEAEPGIVAGSFLPALVPAAFVVLAIVCANIIGEELSERIGGEIPA